MITTKIYTEPKVNKKEILRYAGCKGDSEHGDIEKLLEECLEEALPRLSYKLCYLKLPLVIIGDSCDFGCMQVQSKALVKNLTGCERVILFAATIGVEIDRLITKYGRVSPTKALMMQAIGAERIEALCDVFCEDIEKKINEEADETIETRFQVRPRFSPGYGDVPLEIQHEIFRLLDCAKNIGLTLNNSLLMAPSKSVTAFVGIAEPQQDKVAIDCIKKEIKCAVCSKIDCQYREV